MIRTPYKIPKICVQVALSFEWWNVIAALNKKNKKWGNYMYSFLQVFTRQDVIEKT